MPENTIDLLNLTAENITEENRTALIKICLDPATNSEDKEKALSLLSALDKKQEEENATQTDTSSKGQETSTAESSLPKEEVQTETTPENHDTQSEEEEQTSSLMNQKLSLMMNRYMRIITISLSRHLTNAKK